MTLPLLASVLLESNSLILKPATLPGAVALKQQPLHPGHGKSPLGKGTVATFLQNKGTGATVGLLQTVPAILWCTLQKPLLWYQPLGAEPASADWCRSSPGDHCCPGFINVFYDKLTAFNTGAGRA